MTPRRPPTAVPHARAIVGLSAAGLLAAAIASGLQAPGGLVATLACGSLAAAGIVGALGARAADGAERVHRATRSALTDRMAELSTIRAVGRGIVSSVDLRGIAATIERECRRSFEFDFFFVALLDPKARQFRTVYHRRGLETPQEALQPLGQSLASWVATTKRAIRIEDLLEQGASLPFRPLVYDESVRSAVAVPLLVEDRVVGVLSVQSRRASAYGEHHLALLETVGHQAAAAVENARHFAMATVDSLTGLFLRDYFFHRLEEEATRARRYAGRFALLMVDLDGFKEINDRFGHLAGDRYLEALGETIRARLRSADLACRYGGDEFCLLLPETSLWGAVIIAERLRRAVAALGVDHDGATLRTTASVGVAPLNGLDAGDLPSLLRRADEALYAAKRAGRDRVTAAEVA